MTVKSELKANLEIRPASPSVPAQPEPIPNWRPGNTVNYSPAEPSGAPQIAEDDGSFFSMLHRDWRRRGNRIKELEAALAAERERTRNAERIIKNLLAGPRLDCPEGWMDAVRREAEEFGSRPASTGEAQ